MNHHTHSDEGGTLISCYHACKSVLTSSSFWFGVTFSFPLEHFLWEHVWPFKIITHWLGL